MLDPSSLDPWPACPPASPGNDQTRSHAFNMMVTSEERHLIEPGAFSIDLKLRLACLTVAILSDRCSRLDGVEKKIRFQLQSEGCERKALLLDVGAAYRQEDRTPLLEVRYLSATTEEARACSRGSTVLYFRTHVLGTMDAGAGTLPSHNNPRRPLLHRVEIESSSVTRADVEALEGLLQRNAERCSEVWKDAIYTSELPPFGLRYTTRWRRSFIVPIAEHCPHQVPLTLVALPSYLLSDTMSVHPPRPICNVLRWLHSGSGGDVDVFFAP